MTDLRILVVEDDPQWQGNLAEFLKTLGTQVQVHIASTYATALDQIARYAFALATIDLNLADAAVPANAAQPTERAGIRLLAELRNSSFNQYGCGLIVVTGYGTVDITSAAFTVYAVDDFIDKLNFLDDVFLQKARAAIGKARIRHAVARYNARQRLKITCTEEYLVMSELHTTPHMIQPGMPLRATEFVRRADMITTLAGRGDTGLWSAEAASVGGDFYQMLTAERQLLGDLSAARAGAHPHEQLWLELISPASGLGLPFELLRDASVYLSLGHVLTRRLQVPFVAPLTGPFYLFMQQLLISARPLRILIVDPYSTGAGVYSDEVRNIITITHAELGLLGLKYDVVALYGAEASYDRLLEVIRAEPFDILHYAENRSASRKHPEAGSPVLRRGDDLMPITAAHMSVIAQQSHLRMVFLNCNIGTQAGSAQGPGHFHSLLEALVSAGVPAVLAHRWNIGDTPASTLAQTLYRELWRSFSPAEALLVARQALAFGYGNEMGLAPILISQSE